jgi:hypothetical protein
MIIGIAILTYIDKIYLKDNSNFSITKINVSSESQLTNLKLKIDSDATNVQSSYNGGYLSYLSGKKLKFYNMYDGKSHSVPSVGNMEIMNYTWLYDRNRLLIAEKTLDTTKGRYMKMYYYSISDNQLTEISNTTDNMDLKFTLKAGTILNNIEMSTLTNLVYLKFTDTNGTSSVQCFNIMAQKLSLHINSGNIGNIVTLKQSSVLLHENADYGYVYKYNLGTKTDNTVKIDNTKKLKLLGVDSNDNAYFAPTSTAQTDKIYFGTLDDLDAGTYHIIQLPNTANCKDITVTPDGTVYQNEKGSALIDLTNKKKLDYQGELIGIYPGGFVVVDNLLIKSYDFSKAVPLNSVSSAKSSGTSSSSTTSK